MTQTLLEKMTLNIRTFLLQMLVKVITLLDVL